MAFKIIHKIGPVETIVSREAAQEALGMALDIERRGSQVHIAGPDGVRMTPADFRTKHGLVGNF